MSDSLSDVKNTPQGGRLRDALASARDQQAARFDAVEEVHALAAARLYALADELAPVFADVPEGNTLFVCEVVPGDPPRLWIDMLAYVVIDTDGRTFRFVMNARNGRQTLAESAETSEISGHVVSYIAHRLVDLERAGATAPAKLSGPAGGRYTGGTLALAWVCGFAVGALGIFAIAVMANAGS